MECGTGTEWASEHEAMKRIDFDDFVKQNRTEFRRFCLKTRIAHEEPRSFRRRPRDPEESDILTYLVKARWERALSSGEIIRVGPRRYRIDVFK
ncbi:MAG: hypothetical protein HPY71_05455 [Firmicutes bacterium]|nr:hypothetical protein [Bacillota bacterium]